MAGTCVLLHEQMDALLLAGLFLRGGAIGLLTLQAMTAALESTPKSLAADAGMLARISTMLGGAAAVLVCAHLAPAAAVCFLIFAALAATASFSAVWWEQSAAFPGSRLRPDGCGRKSFRNDRTFIMHIMSCFWSELVWPLFF